MSARNGLAIHVNNTAQYERSCKHIDMGLVRTAGLQSETCKHVKPTCRLNQFEMSELECMLSNKSGFFSSISSCRHVPSYCKVQREVSSMGEPL